ncbi:hypothetical protein AMAG_02954 [Allomyces macrogynus ATCC 38327]|uniref:SH3 domain-containing protein n=1 Tax=Allomyces macrogynus (strain ATCC 38327) TaxID=578462 RepID=A0A0L0S3S8_ALLM3|nr:hypothetical protein AMAG_02954 [Allomyces macrogynus ATCC 38327]|eukprot:KNE57213.1 hypothetical protein AMAG_02954 [Allomyces macrogynus ATCC 38327]
MLSSNHDVHPAAAEVPGPAMPLMLTKHAFHARDGTDELTVPARAIVSMTPPPKIEEPSTDYAADAFWVHIAFRGEQGFVPRHLLTPLDKTVLGKSPCASSESLNAPAPERPKSQSRSRSRSRARHAVPASPSKRSPVKPSALSGRVSPTRRVSRARRSMPSFLSTSKRATKSKLSQQLTQIATIPAAPASQSATSPLSTQGAIQLTLHRVDHFPYLTPDAQLDPDRAQAQWIRSAVRVSLLRAGQVVGNVHVATAYPESPLHKCRTWRFTEKSHLFGSGEKYDDNRLVVRFDPTEFETSVVFELVHTIRIPPAAPGLPAVRRDVSAGWTALNLFNSAGTPLAQQRYTLTVRDQRPCDKDSMPQTPTTPGDGKHPTSLIVGVTAVPKKWHATTLSLPPRVVCALDSVSLAAHYCHVLAAAAVDARTRPAADYVQSDPILAWLGPALDDLDHARALAVAWRAERKRIPVAIRHDLDAAQKWVRRLVVAWHCVQGDLARVQLGADGKEPKPVTAPNDAVAALNKPMATTQYTPFTTAELKYWLPPEAANS